MSGSSGRGDSLELPKSNSKSSSLHLHHVNLPVIPPVLHIKSKFDSEFRRFSCQMNAESPITYEQFRNFVEEKHGLRDIPFTLCYTSTVGDLLPITNNDNFYKSFESAVPTLRILIQRKGEAWEDKYGYGLADRKKNRGFSLFTPASSKPQRRNYNISNPENFRQVSAILDVHIVPDTHRRVRLCKHSESDRPLGFYIRTQPAIRITPQGPLKGDGIFISRLLEGGLAESTGLLSVGDEIIEVCGISVEGKTIDQVTDMLLAQVNNLIITTKPANQLNTLQRNRKPEYQNGHEQIHYAASNVVHHNGHGHMDNGESESDEDEIIHHRPNNIRNY